MACNQMAKILTKGIRNADYLQLLVKGCSIYGQETDLKKSSGLCDNKISMLYNTFCISNKEIK